MTVFFVCGGSAGHVNPALAIAAELRKKVPDAKILFVGANKTIENRLVPAAGFELINIDMSGLRRGLSPGDMLHNIKTAKNLLSANRKSLKILKTHRPDAVIGTGGYICYPVLKNAAKRGIPTFVLEPNAYPGLAVRMLSAIVDKIFVTYPGLENRYKQPERVVYTGTPLISDFIEHDDPAESYGMYEKPLAVSYWGSLGAAGMNEKILQFIKRNIDEGKFNHIHATGVNGSANEMRKKLKNMGAMEIIAPVADIREYIDDMPEVMRAADIVISRAGASTIAQCQALGKPNILIPSPYVPNNHQEINAMQLQEAGGAIMIKEDECTGDMLYGLVTALLGDKEALERMGKAQKSLFIPNAAAKIVEIVLQTAGASVK